MKRREFTQSIVASGAGTAAWLAAGTLGLSNAAHAQTATSAPQEGKDYTRLERAAPVSSPSNQIEVLEFFAYTCVHCYNFEPLLENWIKKKPADVAIQRTPVAFSEAFIPLQRLYYTLQAMGQLPALHAKVFRAIHVDKQALLTPQAITAWVAKQGVDSGKFTELFNSFSITGKAKRAHQIQEAYQVQGTPSLGVGGRYYIEGQGPKTLAVADALIATLRKKS